MLPTFIAVEFLKRQTDQPGCQPVEKKDNQADKHALTETLLINVF